MFAQPFENRPAQKSKDFYINWIGFIEVFIYHSLSDEFRTLSNHQSYWFKSLAARKTEE